MPRGDRTGPQGFGPRTGRAAGYCAGYPEPGYMNPTPGFGRGWGRGWGRGRGPGRGWGRGRGPGRGWGRGWWWYPPHPYAYNYPPPLYPPIPARQSPEDESAALEEYKKELEAERLDLEQEMKEVDRRIKELGAKLEQGKSQP